MTIEIGLKEAPGLKGRQLYLTLVAIALAAFLVSLDGFIVNVAIPAMSGELGVRPDVGTWIITLFTIANTACVPLSVILAKRYGNFPIFIVGMFLFMLASFLIGLSTNFTFLLLSRILQGASAGILTPVSFTLIVNSFPIEKRSIAIGFWGFFVMVGPAMGPMIGGWLSDYRWPWMFYLNIPICLFSLSIVYTFLKGQKEEKESLPFDKIGIFLIFLCVGSLQIAFNRWNIDGWLRSHFIVSLFIVSAAAFIFFLAWEIGHPHPFMHLAYFKTRTFSLCALTTGTGMGLLFSSFVLDSLWVQEVLGYTPAWAGLTLAPVGLFPLIFYPLMGRFISLLNIKTWVIGSFLLYAATFYWLSQITTTTPFWQLALARLIQGIGFASFTIPNSVAAIQGISSIQIHSAISILNFVRLLFVGISVSLAITLWFVRQAHFQSILIARSPLFSELRTPFSQIAHSEQHEIALAFKTIQMEASTSALASIYFLYCGIFLILCLIVLFYKTPNQKHA